MSQTSLYGIIITITPILQQVSAILTTFKVPARTLERVSATEGFFCEFKKNRGKYSSEKKQVKGDLNSVSSLQFLKE